VLGTGKDMPQRQHDDALQELFEIVSGLLGSVIGIDEPLMEAGLDSIGAVELRNSVAAKFGVELPATVTFDYPSVAALAQYLAARTAPPQSSWSQPQTLLAVSPMIAGQQQVRLVPLPITAAATFPR